MIKNGNGEWIEDLNIIKNMFTKFYQNLFTLNTDVSDCNQTDISFPPVDKFKLSILN